MMALATGHLILASIGVGAALLTALLVRRTIHHDPIISHRVLLTFLPVALLVLPLQLVVSEFAPASLIDFRNGTTERSGPVHWMIWLGGAEIGMNGGAAGPGLAGSTSNDGGEGGTEATWIQPIRRGVLALYGTGVFVALAWRAARARKTRRVLRHAQPVTDAAILTMWDQLLSMHGTAATRRSRLTGCPDIAAPACWGWLRRKVLIPVPAHDAIDLEHLQMALLHELVHLRRRDPIAAAFQAVLVIAFWFHPLVWLYSRALDRDRELSCDALVVRMTRKPRSYALAILEYCRRLSQSSGRVAGAMSFAGFASMKNIQRRLNMIAYAQADRSRAHTWLAMAGLSLGLCGVVAGHAALAAAAGPGPVVQQEKTSKPEKPVEVTVKKKDSGVVKAAEIVAPQEKRDPMQLLHMINEMGGSGNGVWITDQETVASSPKASREKNFLEAHEVNLNLPEGSLLKAQLEGESVTIKHEEGVSEIAVSGGRVRILDEGGVARIIAQPAGENSKTAVLHLTATMDNGEVAFKVHADVDGRQVPVRIELDLKTGIPEAEEQPPHGAVRWWLRAEEAQRDKPVQLKMQWIYSIDELRKAQGDKEKL